MEIRTEFAGALLEPGAAGAADLFEFGLQMVTADEGAGFIFLGGDTAAEGTGICFALPIGFATKHGERSV